MQAFRKNLDRNSRIKDLQEKLLSGKLTGSEADLYAVEVGQALAKAFHDEINSDTLPDGKMYYNIASRVIPPPLRACYEDVADYAEAMYQGMNERAKLGIKAQRAKYSTDREKGLIEYACGSDDYSNRQKNLEGSLVNYAQSVATDTMKENAEFQYQAGLSPVIRRSANGGCCEWCAALAGVYPYEEVRAIGSDVYRRHRDCRCTVTYDPGDGKVQNVHTKRWEASRIETSKDGEERQTEIDRLKRIAFSNEESCVDVIDVWKKHRISGNSVSDAEYCFIDGIRRYVDNKNIVIKHDEAEIASAKLLVKTFGGKVVMMPEVYEPKNRRMPDYNFNGVPIDRKGPTGSGKNTIDNQVRAVKGQANSILIDVSKCELSEEQLYEQIKAVFSSKHRDFLDTMIIERDGKIVNVFIRV